MLLERSSRHAGRIENCHDGKGLLWCAEMLAEYQRPGAGIKFIHDNHLEPGATIGEHAHKKDEELYVILSGHGTMKIDGQPTPVGPGDMCLTRPGHSHDLVNSDQGPMHFLVIGVNV